MTVFDKIINREIPAYIVWEDDRHIAFLDIQPIHEGHTLVVPKSKNNSDEINSEVMPDYIFDMNDEDYIALHLAAKKVATLLKSKLDCARICMMVEGFAIPHTHIHLVPADDEHDFDKAHRQHEVDHENLSKVHKRITT